MNFPTNLIPHSLHLEHFSWKVLQKSGKDQSQSQSKVQQQLKHQEETGDGTQQACSSVRLPFTHGTGPTRVTVTHQRLNLLNRKRELLGTEV